MRYFITFTCYGLHLHGHADGSVDRHSNVFGSRSFPFNPGRAASERASMDQEPYRFDQGRRKIVLEAIGQECSHRAWNLLAAQVRSTHVHVVIEAEARPERVMNSFKSYASRALNQAGYDGPHRKRWSRHGSTRWLWNDEDVREAVRYVVEEQGEPMAVFVGEVL